MFRHVEIGEIERAKNALPHYFAVLKGDEQPNFYHARRVEVSFSRDSPLKELWQAHEGGIEKLHDNEISEKPGQSLLDLKVLIARRLLERCILCEMKCGINRRKRKGYCRVDRSRIASAFLHLGEEPELIPSYTIFFSGCNFRCVFCQNWDISQQSTGGVYAPGEISMEIAVAHMQGAKNVNFVGGEPTPDIPFILEVLGYLRVPIPVIWNSNMYMSEEAMKLLDGVVDVYLADFKWGNDRDALKYSKAPRYWETVTRNFLLAREHYRAEFLIRHLVMPGHLKCCTEPILRWISENLGRDVRVNVMFQYRPEYRAGGYPEIARRLTHEEMEEAVRLVREFGLKNALIG
ncbi:radical SAM protein [Thermococcus sp.]